MLRIFKFVFYKKFILNISQTIIIQADYLLPSVFHENMALNCLS